MCDVDDGPGVPPPLRDTASANAAANTSTAAMATERTSQGLGRPSGAGGSGRDGASARGLSSGGRSGEATSDEGPPDVARARRTALSIAPRARRPGVPWAASAPCPSVIDPPGRDSSRFQHRSCAGRPARLRNGKVECRKRGRKPPPHTPVGLPANRRNHAIRSHVRTPRPARRGPCPQCPSGSPRGCRPGITAHRRLRDGGPSGAARILGRDRTRSRRRRGKSATRGTGG